MRTKLPRLAVIAAAVFVVALAGTHKASAGAVSCAPFPLLHNDAIGREAPPEDEAIHPQKLWMPAGSYDIQPTGMSCAAAARGLQKLLEDFDGRLPDVWSEHVEGRGQGSFTWRGASSFEVRRVGPVDQAGLADPSCPEVMSLARTDRLGPLVVPKRNYRLWRVGPKMSCGAAGRLLAASLRDFDGVLPPGWTLHPDVGALVRHGQGIRFKGVQDPSSGFLLGETRCTEPETVRGRWFLGRLRLPAGPYWLFRPGHDLADECGTEAARFRGLLAPRAARLPRHWRLNRVTGELHNASTGRRFRVKPAFDDRACALRRKACHRLGRR